MNPLASLGIAAAVFVAGTVTGWRVESWRVQAQGVKQITHTVYVTQKQGAISADIAAKATAHQDQVRYLTQTITKEIPVYVTAKADAQCVVPVGVVRVLDRAAAAAPDVSDPASAPGGAYDLPSGLALSAVAESVVGNYGSCNATRNQLIDLQAWVTAERAVSEPGR